MSVYCAKEVIKCQGSNCVYVCVCQEKNVQLNEGAAPLTNIRLANTYKPNVAAKLNTMFRKIAFVKKSPRVSDPLWSCISSLSPLNASKSAETVI
jgi:hypothetical protein